MKKLMIAMFVMVFFTFSGFGMGHLSNEINSNNLEKSELKMILGDEYKDVNLDEVPERVKESAKEEGTGIVLKSAKRKQLENGEFVYKVTMESAEKGQFEKSYYATGKKYDDK
jgi:hypothetical protein